MHSCFMLTNYMVISVVRVKSSYQVEKIQLDKFDVW